MISECRAVIKKSKRTKNERKRLLQNISTNKIWTCESPSKQAFIQVFLNFEKNIRKNFPIFAWRSQSSDKTKQEIKWTSKQLYLIDGRALVSVDFGHLHSRKMCKNYKCKYVWIIRKKNFVDDYVIDKTFINEWKKWFCKIQSKFNYSRYKSFTKIEERTKLRIRHAWSHDSILDFGCRKRRIRSLQGLSSNFFVVPRPAQP